jgi:hypothetical protein
MVRRLQRDLEVGADGRWGPITCAALAAWQGDRGLTTDGKAGPATRRALAEHWATTATLTRQAMLELAAPTRGHESGGDPGAVNRDAEWLGHVDAPRRHPETGEFLQPVERAAYRASLTAEERKARNLDAHWASQWNDAGQPREGVHIGLSLGPQQVTQDGGALGDWLEVLWRDHEALVREHLGEHAASIVRMTNRGGGARKVVPGQGAGKRSPRVRQVAGADLWESPHVERLQSLARTPEGDAAHDTVLIEKYILPIVDDAEAVGLMDGGSLAVLIDLAVQFGPGNRDRSRGAVMFLDRAVARARGEGRAVDIEDLWWSIRQHKRGAHHVARRRPIYNASPFWVTYTRT